MPFVFDVSAPGPDYRLLWPPELFRAEILALLAQGDGDADRRIRRLFEEAFAGEQPAIDASDDVEVTWPGLEVPASPWGGLDSRGRRWGFARYLADVADRLPRWTAPRPYWPHRTGTVASAAVLPRRGDWGEGPDRLQQGWAALVEELLDQGYLDKVAPRDCVDAPALMPQVRMLDQETAQRLGEDGLWPLRPGDWADDLFYGLVEVVHDLVARPRQQSIHTYGGCGAHYSDFAFAPGQALYRWKVDQLLERYGVAMQLAGNGEDAGRLVRVAGDDRDILVQWSMASPDPTDQDAVRHAVALFRNRSATRDDRRSAAVALARVLENRRPLIKTELLRRDEGLLFRMANEFDLRHRDADQHHDYDEAYLDWIFWIFLSTIELTNRLLARQGGVEVPGGVAPV